MKHGNTHFVQLQRGIWDEKYKGLSVNAKWLYCTLCELEHRYCGSKTESRDFFFRSNDDLASDVGMSLPTLKRAKKELLDTDLVISWQTHFIDPHTKKKSEKKITAYRIPQIPWAEVKD